jgi:hypothetical protein
VRGFVAALPADEFTACIDRRYSEEQRRQVFFAEQTSRPKPLQENAFPGQNWECPLIDGHQQKVRCLAQRAAPTYWAETGWRPSMPSVVFKSSSFSNLSATGGARLVSPSRAIANKQFAMNGSAYGTPDKVKHYLQKAKGCGLLRDFLGHGGNKTDYLGVANGGIFKPQDTAIWNGTLFRIAFTRAKAPESEVVKNGVSGEWWMERETFLGIVSKVDSPSELLEELRAELALGFKLELDTTKIIATPVNGPVAAYMGQGNVTSDRYDAAQFPILYGNPLVKQLFIPGIRDLNNQADANVIQSSFDIDATNSYDAVGAMARFSPAQDKA